MSWKTCANWPFVRSGTSPAAPPPSLAASASASSSCSSTLASIASAAASIASAARSSSIESMVSTVAQLPGDHPVAAGALGAEQGAVGAIDEGVDRLVGAGGVRDADRDAHAGHADVAEVEVTDGPPDALADLLRDGRAGVAQEHGELLAADAGRHVLVSHGAGDRARNGLQDLV